MTSRREKFQILHGALLLIGGVRRDKPEYCTTAISSFPLHTFYDDTLGLTIELPSASVIDIVLQTFPVDTLSVDMSFNASIIETLLLYSLDDSIALALGTLTASIIDTVKETAMQTETLSIGIDFVLGSTALIDSVVPMDNVVDTISLGFGTLAAVLEDI